MSKGPQCYVPGHSYKITRRVSEGRMLLKPAPGLRRLIAYLLADAALENGVIIHCAVVMGNHIHLVVTDVDGKLGEFMAKLHGLIARAVNRRWGRQHVSLWDPRKPQVQRIVRVEDHLDQFVYVAGNPAKAGAAVTASKYDGLVITPDQIGTTLEFERPDDDFFRTGLGACMPERVRLEICEPVGAEATYGPGGFARLAAEKLAEYERQHQKKLKEETSPKPAAVRRSGSMRDQSSQVAQIAMPETGRLNEIICGDCDLREEILRRLRTFRDDYARAVEILVSGGNPEFPYGTYARRLWGGVRVAPPPQPS